MNARAIPETLSDTTEETPTREGELLGGAYRLGARLGAGGQGEVYRAVNEHTKREVAIKVLHDEWAQDKTTLVRFMREARAANMVRHPNVVEVLDVGTDADGVPFIVQELLRGESLHEYLQRRGGRIDAGEALGLMVSVAEGVGAAHAQGVIHRDLKPGNVFLARPGDGVRVPKVLDFGLAKIISVAEAIGVTSSGQWFGTPGYMSPEQIKNVRRVDARADVWALGAMLYEMLAGRMPFVGRSHGELFVMVCTEDAQPLGELAPDAPRALVRVQQRCMRRDPAERYATGLELAEDLRRARDGRPLQDDAASARPGPATSAAGSARPPSPRPSNRAEVSTRPDPPARVAPRPAPRRTGRVAVIALAAVVGVLVVGWGLHHVVAAHPAAAAVDNDELPAPIATPAAPNALAPNALSGAPEGPTEAPAPSPGTAPSRAHTSGHHRAHGDDDTTTGADAPAPDMHGATRYEP